MASVPCIPIASATFLSGVRLLRPLLASGCRVHSDRLVEVVVIGADEGVGRGYGADVEGDDGRWSSGVGHQLCIQQHA